MSKKNKINIVRAFVDENGNYGNTTGIVVDEEQNIILSDRQKIAIILDFTETVFINCLNPVNISLYNPQQETKFAGDALISTSYFMKHVLGKGANSIICKGGKIRTWEEGGLTWIDASLEGTPSWNHKQLENAEAVNDITKNEAFKFEHTMIWAWKNEEKGLIRSRTFLPDWGTLEDQGNGSGAMQLSKILNRKIDIHQGFGSVIYAVPLGINSASVGGRVKVDKLRLVEI